MRLLQLIVLALILPFGFIACGEQEKDEKEIRFEFEEWDTDQDSTLSVEEFKDGFVHSGYFKYWDANDDGFITEDEFKQAWRTYYMDIDDDGVFEAWDVNIDGSLSKDEHLDGVFTIYDTDKDGEIDSAEYQEAEFKD